MTDTTITPMTTNLFRTAEQLINDDRRTIEAVVDIDGSTVETNRGPAHLQLTLSAHHNRERKEISVTLSRAVRRGHFASHVIHIGGREGIWNAAVVSRIPVARYSKKALHEQFAAALDSLDSLLDTPQVISMQRPINASLDV